MTSVLIVNVGNSILFILDWGSSRHHRFRICMFLTLLHALCSGFLYKTVVNRPFSMGTAWASVRIAFK